MHTCVERVATKTVTMCHVSFETLGIGNSSTEGGTQMKIEMKATGDITPFETNPRINDQAVGAVAKSITDFGFRQPIVVDKDGVIVCGHTRWKAAQQLGLEKVPVHVAADLSPEKARAYRLADNRTLLVLEDQLTLLDSELEALYGECALLKLKYQGHPDPPIALADLDERVTRLRERQARLQAILPALKSQLSNNVPRNPKQEESK